MAQNKKSFVLYTDVKHSLDMLSNEEAGILFKTILDYVNDLNPIIENRYIQLAFEPIKQALKRDLKKYEVYIDKQKENGKKGGRPKTQKKGSLSEKPKKPVSDNVNDIDKRKQNFYEELKSYKTIYQDKTLEAFYLYWTELNPSKTKMRFEQEKTWETKLRLKRWAGNNFKPIQNKVVNMQL